MTFSGLIDCLKALTPLLWIDSALIFEVPAMLWLATGVMSGNVLHRLLSLFD